MHNHYRWPIYAYETLSSIIPRLCVKGDPYTIVANVLFHCSDAIIGNNCNFNALDTISNTFCNEYYKSLCYVYSNSSPSKNICLEYAFSPLNVEIVQKVSPRIRNIPLKLLKSLLHQSINDFKERIDVNGLLKSVGPEDYFEAVGLLRLNHKLCRLTGHNIDIILDFHMAGGQNGRIRSINFVKELIDSETNLDTLINCSNWSLKRILDKITEAECLVSFEFFSESLRYNKLLSQVKQYLESVDESTGLLRTNWGYRMRHHLPTKLHFPEPAKLIRHYPLDELSNGVDTKGSLLHWDSDSSSFVIKLNTDVVSIGKREYTLVDSIAALDKLFGFIQNFSIDKNSEPKASGNFFKGKNLGERKKNNNAGAQKISINLEYTAGGAPSLLALSINLKHVGIKTWIIDLMNSDEIYTGSIIKLIDWILSAPNLIKLGHKIENRIEHLSVLSNSLYKDYNNLYDITTPRIQIGQNGNVINNEWVYSKYTLNATISSLLGINLPKISNWNIRPIPIMNLQYATIRNNSILELDDLLEKTSWKQCINK